MKRLKQQVVVIFRHTCLCFEITILVQIAELENDVADLNARLRTANAGNFVVQHVRHASHNVRQSDRERAEAAVADSQSREAKSLEKMASVKSSKKQLKVQLTHIMCHMRLIYHVHTFCLLANALPRHLHTLSFRITSKPLKSGCAGTLRRRGRRARKTRVIVTNWNARSGARIYPECMRCSQLTFFIQVLRL